VLDVCSGDLSDAVLCEETELPEPPADLQATFRVRWFHRVDAPPGRSSWRGVALCGTDGEFQHGRSQPPADRCPDCERAEMRLVPAFVGSGGLRPRRGARAGAAVEGSS